MLWLENKNLNQSDLFGIFARTLYLRTHLREIALVRTSPNVHAEEIAIEQDEPAALKFLG